jgi:hypothetical protein
VVLDGLNSAVLKALKLALEPEFNPFGDTDLPSYRADVRRPIEPQGPPGPVAPEPTNPIFWAKIVLLFLPEQC